MEAAEAAAKKQWVEAQLRHYFQNDPGLLMLVEREDWMLVQFMLDRYGGRDGRRRIKPYDVFAIVPSNILQVPRAIRALRSLRRRARRWQVADEIYETVSQLTAQRHP